MPAAGPTSGDAPRSVWAPWGGRAVLPTHDHDIAATVLMRPPSARAGLRSILLGGCAMRPIPSCPGSPGCARLRSAGEVVRFSAPCGQVPRAAWARLGRFRPGVVSAWSARPPEQGHLTNYPYVFPQVSPLSTSQDRTPNAGVGSGASPVGVGTWRGFSPSPSGARQVRLRVQLAGQSRLAPCPPQVIEQPRRDRQAPRECVQCDVEGQRDAVVQE